MVRMQIYISRSAREFLVEESQRSNKTQGRLVRDGIHMLARRLDHRHKNEAER